MNKKGAGSCEEYINIIKNNPDELDSLIESISINVTEFFRNLESFSAIDEVVIPRVIASKRNRHHKIIRAWSCGCSAGDEPYSLAILLSEKLGMALDKFSISIIGSDIDKGAIADAKEAVYSKNRLRALSSGIIDRYFERIDGDRYGLIKEIKKMVKFRTHNIVKDYPFRHCDIIMCRNLLIYFNKQLQEETLLKFFECLNPGGFLVLGMSESLVGSVNKALETVNNRMRIYRKPEPHSCNIGGEGVLSQAEIDNIVKEILE